MLELLTVITIGLPATVSGTVPSGATQAITKERIGVAVVCRSELTRVVESSKYAVITVPSGSAPAV